MRFVAIRLGIAFARRPILDPSSRSSGPSAIDTVARRERRATGAPSTHKPQGGNWLLPEDARHG